MNLGYRTEITCYKVMMASYLSSYHEQCDFALQNIYSCTRQSVKSSSQEIQKQKKKKRGMCVGRDTNCGPETHMAMEASTRAHNACLLVLKRTRQLCLLLLPRLLPQQRRRKLRILLCRTQLRLVEPRQSVRMRVRRCEREHGGRHGRCTRR